MIQLNLHINIISKTFIQLCDFLIKEIIFILNFFKQFYLFSTRNSIDIILMSDKL